MCNCAGRSCNSQWRRRPSHAGLLPNLSELVSGISDKGSEHRPSFPGLAGSRFRGRSKVYGRGEVVQLVEIPGEIFVLVDGGVRQRHHCGVSPGGIDGAVNWDKKADSASYEWFYIRGCDVEVRLVLSRTDSDTVASSLRHRGDRSDNCSSWQIVRVGIPVTMWKESQVESEDKPEVVKGCGTLKVVKHRR